MFEQLYHFLFNKKSVRASLKNLYYFGLMKLDTIPASVSSLFYDNDWPHLIFIAGLPKSGTTWLAQLLEQLPGYKPARLYDPDSCNENHDICNNVFEHLPNRGRYVMKLHTHYSPSNMKVLDKFKIQPVIMYRDIRDQCISRYYHVLNDPSHRHCMLYNSIPRDEAVSHSIDIAIEYYLPWIENWRSEVLKQPRRFFEVKYESLRQDTGLVLSKVLDFYQIDLPRETIDGIVRKLASRTRFDLRENLRNQKGTARKGVVGDWRNHFNSDHIRMIKEKCGQHLIDLGYERDFAWSND